MKIQNTLKSIYGEFCDKRKKHVSNRWRSYISFIKRTLGSNKEFRLLLESETKFQTEMYCWLSRYIDDNRLSINDVKKTIISLKLFKEELNGRSLFLVLFIVLLGLSAAVSNYLATFINSAETNNFIVISLSFTLILVIERGHVINNILNANQLEIFLEKWLDESNS